MTPAGRDSAVHLPRPEWWQRHAIDAVILVLGVSANLRLWLGFFAVQQLSFAIPVIVAAGCETVRRLVAAGRNDVRPSLFTGDRRFDLIAALFLMIGADPITLPAVGILSPSAWWRALVLPPCVPLGSGLAILAATVVQATVGTRRSCVSSLPRIRDLAAVPSVHIASLVVVPDFRTA